MPSCNHRLIAGPWWAGVLFTAIGLAGFFSPLPLLKVLDAWVAPRSEVWLYAGLSLEERASRFADEDFDEACLVRKQGRGKEGAGAWKQGVG